MLSSRNRIVHVKVSKNVYDFINTISKKYKVSVSAFCQDCITQSILLHDKRATDPKYSGSSPGVYYKKLSKFINMTYDGRRK